MNDSKVRSPYGGFEDRLEAELVTVVTQRAAFSPGRSARRRLSGRAGWALAGAVAAAAAAAVAVPVLTHPAASPSAALSNGPGSVHIRTAAFTLDSYSNGTIHVSWDKRSYFHDPAGLQQALRAAGFPVLIKEGTFCTGPGDNGSLDASGVGPGVSQVMTAQGHPDGTVTFIFTPSAMPAGDELFIGYLTASQLSVTHGRPGSVERLVPANEPLTCTTQAPPPAANQQPSAPAK